MNIQFADTLRKLRIQKGLTQSQLANLMFVNKATISKWESGSRLPDAAMIIRLAEVLRVDVKKLLSATAEINESFNIIMVDDNKVILSYNQLILEEVAPNAAIASFSRPQKAIEYAKKHRTDLAFLDIEMGVISGFDLCRELLEINPCTKVVYLTAYPEYSLNAWGTDACGFMVKPLITEDVRRQLKKLRYPFSLRGEDE
ncbi:response regulator [Ruminococcus difficilis]|jgi:transcriptional regulator with XRE-family HTH domain|uniref:Stage 0 sporulation protein A homolog n=1 Tax=Ruminococcus difficilis TaxID=2763069 RepID=A0A934WRX6_9FIRM|nr:response regulator [Ruminococcus difficilis]MBK6088812.1 response regulator [Ruminococcus difficilis]